MCRSDLLCPHVVNLGIQVFYCGRGEAWFNRHIVMEHFVVSTGAMPTELQLKMSQLFTSPLSEQLLADCVRDCCLTRITVARDLLLFICFLQYRGEVYVYMYVCVCNYTTLYTSQLQYIIEANLDVV